MMLNPTHKSCNPRIICSSLTPIKKFKKKIQIEPSLHKNIDKWERKTYTRGAQHDKKKKLADCMVEVGLSIAYPSSWILVLKLVD